MATSQIEAAASPLTFLADVAVHLNGDRDVVRKATDVLERTVRALQASECSLWLETPKGMGCAARAGVLRSSKDELVALLAAGDADHGTISVRRLTVGGRPVGALVLRNESGIGRGAATALTAVANMLAPVLSWAEQTQALAAEVERRTRELDEERRFIEGIVDSLPVSIYVIDREYRVKAWNRGRESGSQGVQRERALGKTIFEILHRAPAEKLRREFDEVFRTGRIQQFSLESRGAGEPRTYRITKIPMQVVEGEPPSHVITIGEDVSDVTASQARLLQAERFASIGRLAAGVVQALTGPLDTVAAGAATLGAQLDEAGSAAPPKARATIGAISRELLRSREMIDGILALTRPASTDRTWANVNGLIEQALVLLGHQPRFKRLAIQSFLDPDLPRVSANEEQLLQALLAVLENAADAMENGGTLTVRTRAGTSSHETAVIEVIDEGRGISRTDLPHIFEPFFTTKGPGQGTGLGLSICYSIITGHGGRIEVDSAVGAGSTFRMLLPEGSDL